MTSGEYVAQLGDTSAHESARHALEAFLASDDDLLLVVGEPGSGKSLLTWSCVQSLLEKVAATIDDAPRIYAGDSVQYTAALSSCSRLWSPVSAGGMVWIPLVIDLKQFQMSQLDGLLARYLQTPEWCALPSSTVTSLREGAVLPGIGKVGLLVMCDGFDELHAEATEAAGTAARLGLVDFYRTVQGSGLPWAAKTLKVLVTCRESSLSDPSFENTTFGAHRRRYLLPFSEPQVWRYRHFFLNLRACGISPQ
jgi:hypothetical protein